MNYEYLKIKIIACYVGEFPEYFDLWLLSCEYNPTIDFLVVSDQEEPNIHPKNVKFLKENLNELKNRFQKTLGFEVNLNSAYKLCDFRPIYGLAFKEYLEGYDFWGHCDIDLIWGDIRKFIGKEILINNDKIFKWGHLSLFKNNNKTNNIFKEKGSIFTFKEVFKNDEYYAFDEITGIKKIINENNLSIYDNDFSANISRKYSRMRLVENGKNINYNYQVFYWENGKILRAYIDNNNVFVDEFIYLHFQWKKPTNKLVNKKEIDSFYILAEHFIKKEKKIPSFEEIIDLSYFKGKKYDSKENIAYINKLIKNFIKGNLKQKRIWIKQKLG